jgi:hypothetical protein
MGELEKIIVQSDIAHSGRDDLSYLDWMKGISGYCASKAVDLVGTAAIVASGIGLTVLPYMGTECLLDKFVGTGGYQNDMIYFLTLLPVSVLGLAASTFAMVTVGLTASDYSQRLLTYSHNKLHRGNR